VGEEKCYKTGVMERRVRNNWGEALGSLGPGRADIYFQGGVI